MAAFSDNVRGAALMTGAMAAFTINDAFLKGVSASLPLMQIIFLRGLFVLPLMVGLCFAMGQLRFDFGARNWRFVIIRTVAEMAAATLFLTALYHMPIANVSAIMQVLPLSVTLAAAVVLREPIGWRRLTAIAIGFGGVLLIIQPGGADFSIYALYAVAAVAAVTIRDLAARQMTQDVPSTAAAFIAAIGVTLLGGVGLLAETWAPVSWSAIGLLVAASVFIIAAYIFSVSAMRIGEIGFVAPFRYTSLLVALVLGYVVFGDVPKVLTLIGAAIVVAMGLFTLYREQRLRARAGGADPQSP